MHDDEEKPQNHDRWLLTYSDLITLLLIFFIVLYSASRLDLGKYQAISKTLNAAMGGGKIVAQDPINNSTKPDDIIVKPTAAATINPTGEKVLTEEELRQLSDKIRKILKRENLYPTISSSIQDRGIVISIDAIFFDTGKSEINPKNVGKFIKVGKILSNINNYIRIEGNTDNIPIKTALFPSNWELSVLRATTVCRLFIDKCNIVPTKISAVGYSEYRPVDSNGTEKGRSHNRRVDIVILRTSLDPSESH